METIPEMSREEMQKAIEKAQRDLEEIRAKMTPEERAEADRRAQKMLEEDEAEHRRLIESAKQLLGKRLTGVRPKFCTNCGAPAGEGKFCTNCGSPLLG